MSVQDINLKNDEESQPLQGGDDNAALRWLRQMKSALSRRILSDDSKKGSAPKESNRKRRQQSQLLKDEELSEVLHDPDLESPQQDDTPTPDNQGGSQLHYSTDDLQVAFDRLTALASNAGKLRKSIEDQQEIPCEAEDILDLADDVRKVLQSVGVSDGGLLPRIAPPLSAQKEEEEDGGGIQLAMGKGGDLALEAGPASLKVEWHLGLTFEAEASGGQDGLSIQGQASSQVELGFAATMNASLDLAENGYGIELAADANMLVGLKAGVEATAALSKDGVNVAVGLEAFVGARASGTATAKAKLAGQEVGQVALEVTASIGAGGKAELVLMLGTRRISTQAKLEACLGAGVGINLGADVDLAAMGFATKKIVHQLRYYKAYGQGYASLDMDDEALLKQIGDIEAAIALASRQIGPQLSAIADDKQVQGVSLLRPVKSKKSLKGL